MEIHTDDAPLIVKQNFTSYKCASCSQSIENFNSHNRSNSQSLTNENFNKTYNLKSLHDHYNKFGGSYSKILANSNADTLKDEFTQINANNRMHTETDMKRTNTTFDKVTFPQVKTVFNKNNTNIAANKLKVKSVNKENLIEDSNDERLKTVVDSELKHSTLKGENLLKITNKYFNIKEKEKEREKGQKKK